MDGIKNLLGVVLGGALFLAIGYATVRLVLSSAAAAGSDTNAPSFAGFSAISDIGPLALIGIIIAGAVAVLLAGSYIFWQDGDWMWNK